MAEVIKIDLPISEVTGYLEGLLNELGDECVIDDLYETKIMISDLQRAFNNLQENSKQAVISKSIPVDRGSIIRFKDGRTAIVHTIPNNDIVSYSCKILMCNGTVKVYGYNEQYAPNGDVISKGEYEKSQVMGFIERLTAREKQFDGGLLHESILRFTTYVDADIDLDDIVSYKGKKYRVIDIDDITDGLWVVQLATVRK
jgi:uncharacterized protein YkvS